MAIAICLAVVALIVVVGVLLQRRKAARRDFDMCDESDLDLDAAIEIDTEAQPQQYDTRNVLQEGFPGDKNTRYRPGIEDADSVEGAQSAVRNLSYAVVTDES